MHFRDYVIKKCPFVGFLIKRRTVQEETSEAPPQTDEHVGLGVC